jgi:hypothetical protein
MKYVITERQYKVITEQVNGINSPTLTPSSQSSLLKPTMNVASGVKDVQDISMHTVLEIAGIASAFVPFAGPFLSAGIGLYDAKLYYDEGDTKSAAITGAFSMIPFIGKIPGVKELGAKGMALLGSKLAKGAAMGGKVLNKAVAFSKSEIKVLNAIKQSEALIKQGLENASTKLSPSVVKSVESLKPTFIKKFGQQKYDDLLSKYIQGKITKESFLKSLNSATADTYKMAKMVVQSGLKFSKTELNGISELVPLIKKGKEGIYKLELTVNGVNKEIEVYVKSFPNQTFNGQAVFDNGNKIYMNIDNLKGKSVEKIREILSHEAAHIKDPSIISPKLNKSYDKIVNAKKSEWSNYQTAYTRASETGKGADEAIKAGEKYKDLVQRYLYHPQEVVANNQMVLNNMATEMESLISQVGPKGAKKELDNLIAYTSGKQPLSKLNLKLLGDGGFNHLTGLYKYNKKYYQDFLKKIAKQSEYLKSQLNLMNY